MDVTPGETLYLYVGEGGDTPQAGWPNGGSGGDQSGTGSGGGGSSDIRIGGNTLNDRLLVAAGGGGGSANFDGDGGSGGADIGAGGTGDGERGGHGGTQTSGGDGGIKGGTGIDGDDGLFGRGGDAADGASSNEDGGGGGGGGWYGGGGGASADDTASSAGGGGGGSNYDEGALTVYTNQRGGNTGDGQIVLEPIPVAPNGVSIDDTTNNSVSLSWNPVGSADGYRVGRSQFSGGGYTFIDDTSNTSSVDISADEGTTYHYIIRAYQGSTDFDSDNSAEVSTTTILPNPENLSVESISEHTVGVSFDLLSSDEDEVRVYRQLDNDAWVQSDFLNPGTETHTYIDLLGGRDYNFKVSAWTPDVESESNVVSAITDIPSVSNKSSQSEAQGEISFSWDSTLDNGNYYLELRRSGESNVLDSDSVVYSQKTYTFDSQIVDGRTYEVSIRSETVEKESDYSTFDASSFLPSILTTEIDYQREGSVRIAWDKRDNNTEGTYQIFRSQSSGLLGERVFEINNLNQTEFFDEQVSPMNGYYYTIRRVTE